MNAKIQKTVKEIDKTKEKIAEMQARLKELEQQKVELENLEIIALVRGIDVEPENFAEFIKTYKAGGAFPPPAPAIETKPIIKEMEATENEKE